MIKRRKPKYDLIGRKVGFLTVISHTNKFSKQKNGIYLCQCDCGNTKELSSSCLTEKASWKPSCGCQAEKFKNRLFPGEVSFNTYYSKYREGAKRRNIQFNLDKEEFKILIQQNCYYCGMDPKPYNPYVYHKRDGTEKLIERNWIKVNGIDRVDSSDNYNINNCVSCCTTCNLAKRDLSKSDFLNWIKKIYEVQFGK